MTERYPFILDKGRVATISSGGDILQYCDNVCRSYLWLDMDISLDVSKYINSSGVLNINSDELTMRLGHWVEGLPYINARAFDDVNELTELIVRQGRKFLEGKTVVLAYSGGKDSTAALILALKLMEHVSIKLRVIYVYMPYIESVRNIKFVEYVGRRLGINVEISEPKRRYVRKMLRWLGLPRRGNRWCTYFKVRPIRRIVRGNPKVIEAVADRMFESPKRALRLGRRLRDGLIVSKKKFTPVAFLTVTDVMYIVKKYGLVHPAYLEGLPRVSCTLCPYKTLFEFNVREDLEDPGLIDEVIMKEYKKSYVYSKIPLEDFMSNALWRFKPITAYRLYLLKKILKRNVSEHNKVSYYEAKTLYIKSWDSAEIIRKKSRKLSINALINKVEEYLRSTRR